MWKVEDFGSGALLFTAATDSLRVGITNWGGAITKIETFDQHGHMDHIAFGHDDCASYQGEKTRFFGCITGRFANRIARGRFALNGKEYTLPINNGPNSLHGGIEGFDKKFWAAEVGQDHDIILRYTSPDGEEGYPGALETSVRFQLVGNELRIFYQATARGADTIVNLTNHSYFNLDGCGTNPVSKIDDHLLLLHSKSFAAVDNTGIPTGIHDIAEGSAFDFSTWKRMGDQIDEPLNEQLIFQKGYDHSFKIDKQNVDDLVLAAQVKSAKSGRVLEVFTTEPFVHFYSGNHLHPKLGGRNDVVYTFRNGFCLETQHMPNAPNVDDSTLLKKDCTFKSTTIFKFK